MKNNPSCRNGSTFGMKMHNRILVTKNRHPQLLLSSAPAFLWNYNPQTIQRKLQVKSDCFDDSIYCYKMIMALANDVVTFESNIYCMLPFGRKELGFSRLFMSMLFASLILWTTDAVYAQVKGNKESIGLYLGAGGQWFGLVPHITPYDYDVVMLHLSYGYTVKQWNKALLDVLGELKAGRARFAEPGGPPWNMAGEFGAAVGLRQLFYFRDESLGSYLMLLSGPHHISDSPQRQVAGFLFDNHAYGGLIIKLDDWLFLDMRLGWRHLSNAGIKEPNGGINTLVIQIGCLMRSH